MTLNAGDNLGGYRLIRIVGEGGMGVVWEAEQVSLARRVALKVVRPAFAAETEYRERFQNEARIAGSLDHPNIVTVFDASEVDGHVFLSMALVEGPSIREVLNAEGSLAPARAVSVVTEVAAGLAAAHATGLVHRDVKPSNILLDVAAGRAVITDFGIAKALDATRATSTGQMLGTLNYMAPEQLQGGQIDARVDVYSLGAVLYELLTGKAPFARDTHAATMWAHVNDEPPKPSLVPGVPEALDAVAAKAMAKIPSERYETASELALAAAVAVGSELTEITRIAPVVDERTKIVAGGWSGATKIDTRQGPRTSAPPIATSKAAEAGKEKSGVGRRVLLVAVVLLLGALIGGGGAVAVPMILKKETTTAISVSTETQTDSQTTTETVTSTDSSASTDAASTDPGLGTDNLPVGVSDYSGDGYTASVPDGWSQTDARLAGTTGSRMKWINPADPNVWVLIETTPNNRDSAIDSAYTVRGQRGGEIKSVSLGGNDGAEWPFTYKHVDPPYQTDQRIDYFVNVCSTGVAILGSSSPADFSYWAPLFYAVANSVKSTDYC